MIGRGVLRAWTDFWDRREAPTSLALVRILVAGALLADLLVARAYGVVALVWTPPEAGGIGWGASTSPPLLVRWLGATPATAATLFAVAVVAAALFLIGAATRASGVVLLLVLAELARIAPDSDRGVDMLLRIAVGILILSGSHARWSVDALVKARRGRPAPALVPAWPRYLLFAQLVWLYFSAAQNRTAAAWSSEGGFAALSYILSEPHLARFAPGWMASLYPLTQAATAATMLFEWTAPLLIVTTWCAATRDRPGRLRRLVDRTRVRWIWIGFGVAFHLGIALTLKLGIFSFGILALYPALLHPDELAAAWQR